MNNSLLKRTMLLSIALVLVAVFTIGLISAEPNGAQVTKVSSGRGTTSSAVATAAQAGNVSEITLYGDSITQTWQGYYGNVSGVIKLADAGDNVMYNWTVS